MAQQARLSGDIARELRDSIMRQEDATAQYRAKKLQDTEEYRRKKLELLCKDKENIHPNAEDGEAVEERTMSTSSSLRSSCSGSTEY